MQDTSILYYERIYQYIKDLPEIKSSCINVSDTIVHLELTNFWEELSEGKSKSKDAIFMKLDSIDNSRMFKNYALPQLKDFERVDSCKNVLFFSKVYKNMVLAELIDNRGELSNNHDVLTSFNKSDLYLFKFDSEKKIEKVYSKQIEYD